MSHWENSGDKSCKVGISVQNANVIMGGFLILFICLKYRLWFHELFSLKEVMLGRRVQLLYASPTFHPHSVPGIKDFSMEVSSDRTGNSSTRGRPSQNGSFSAGLEAKLDELRREISSSSFSSSSLSIPQGGMFPHAILSAQQMRTLCAQKPTSLEQVRVATSVCVCVCLLVYSMLSLSLTYSSIFFSRLL